MAPAVARFVPSPIFGKKHARNGVKPPSPGRAGLRRQASPGTPGLMPLADGEPDMIPYDRPDAVGAWWERRIPRLAISPFVGRERQARYRIGRLAVDVLAAARLAAADWEGTSDPYVVVSLSGHQLGRPKPGVPPSEWPEVVRGHHKTKHVLRNLNPVWTDEGADFDVWRHGGVLRVEVYDYKEFETDPRIGLATIELAPLANAGPVEKWWPLEKKGGVRLRLRYEVDPLAEAASMLWLDPKPLRPPPKFDVNVVYGHALTIKHRLDPGIKAARKLQDVLKWKRPVESAACLACAVAVAALVDNYFLVLHAAAVAFLLFTRRERDRALKREARLKELFQEIDADRSGRVDLAELKAALALVAASGLAPPACPEHTKRLFARHAAGAGSKRALDFSGFVEVEKALGIEKDLDVAAGSDPSPKRATAAAALGQMKATAAAAKAVAVRKKSLLAKVEPETGGAPGPRLLKGNSLSVVNYAANSGSSGRKLGLAQKELAFAQKELDELRDLAMWVKPDKTLKILAANVVCFAAHCILAPRRIVPFYACGAFFVLTEQFYGALAVAARLERAAKRYRALLKVDKHALRLDVDAKADPALWSSVKQCRSSNQAAMERALRGTIGSIFKRVDADGSGRLSREEVVAFVRDEIACPKRCSDVSDRLVAAMASFDGALDERAFTEVVLNSDVAEALLVSEFERQLPKEGVQCVKLATSLTSFSRPTVVAARDDADGACLAYRRKAQYWTRIPFDRITKIEQDDSKPHVMVVEHKAEGPKPQTLKFNLANPFYAAALVHVARGHQQDALSKHRGVYRGRRRRASSGKIYAPVCPLTGDAKPNVEDERAV